MQSLTRSTRTSVLVITMLFGFGLGFATSSIRAVPSQPKNNASAVSREVRQGGYSFINPLLECESSEGVINSNLVGFRSSIEKIVTKAQEEQKLSLASVYFRDLNNGPWFGINEKAEFLPASLRKLPLAMNFFKLAEQEPNILHERITLLKKAEHPDKIQTIRPSQEIEEGKEYSVEDLIDRALIFSDNQAALLLNETVVPELQRRGYMSEAIAGIQSDLDVLASILGDQKETMSVKNYSGLFRVLFNASFVNRPFSEKILERLSLAEYKDGLVAGVPSGVVVSHKFGEAGQFGVEVQFHDCGIVYYPKHPYILCVMTRGEKLEALPKVIREISAEVYRNVDEQEKARK